MTQKYYLSTFMKAVSIYAAVALAIKTNLENTKAKLEAQDFAGLTKDDLLGDMFYATAFAYYAELDAMDYVSAKKMGLVAIRLPSEAHFSVELSVYSVFGIPMSISAGGFAMDVDRTMTMVKTLDGDTEKPRQFFLSSGMNGSALEHSVPEQLFSTPEEPAYGISAVKALKIANDQGIPIYTINQTNIDSILPQLLVDAGTITDIRNAVNAGKEATVQKMDITYNGWAGHGYIIIDPNTGAGAYMISGGMNGADIRVIEELKLLLFNLIMKGSIKGLKDAITEYLTIVGEFLWDYGDCMALHVFTVATILGNVGMMVKAAQVAKTTLWVGVVNIGFVIFTMLTLGGIFILADSGWKCAE